MNILLLSGLSLQPSQFYLSEAKLRAVQAWLDKGGLSLFQPVPVKSLGGRILPESAYTEKWDAWRDRLHALQARERAQRSRP